MHPGWAATIVAGEMVSVERVSESSVHGPHIEAARDDCREPFRQDDDELDGIDYQVTL